MRDKLSGKPHDSSIGEEILHSVIPQRWRFLRQLPLSACPRKPQQYSVYARLENPFLAWAWRRKAWGSLLKNLEASRHEQNSFSWRFAPMVYLTAVCYSS